ncbi:hypothetical protein GCM10022211_01440 [Sphingomonas humi]|uniref:Uncharacterized protein n=1 Tax=Sphingomonas humi TaxID=335630 RepID=A0ABP7RED4_9SPHN
MVGEQGNNGRETIGIVPVRAKVGQHCAELFALQCNRCLQSLHPFGQFAAFLRPPATTSERG